MKRPLLLLLLVLGGLIIADGSLQRARSAQRVSRATLRPVLAPAKQIVPDRVRRIVLRRAGSRDFTYVRDGELWRFPAYHNALAYTDRLQRMLQISLLGTGTLVSTDPDDVESFGLAPAPLQLDFYGAEGDLLVKLSVAGGQAGPGGVESYVQVAGNDSILRLHADPEAVIGRGQPPMIDPHLLPRAVPRDSPVTVEALHLGERQWHLQRVLAPLPEDAPPMPLSDSQRYLWLLHFQGRVDTCDFTSVTTYLRYLQGLQVRALSSDTSGASQARLRLTDEDGHIDELIVLQQHRELDTDPVAVRNRRAGIVALLPSIQVEAMTPPVSVLIDSLSKPSLFELALNP